MSESRQSSPYGAPKSPGSEDRTKLYVIVGAVVAVVLVAVIAVLITARKSNPDGSKKGTGAYAAAHAEREQAPVTVTGTPLPEYPKSAQASLVPPTEDPAVGQVPPKLEGVSFDGSGITIDPTDGRAKVVMFIAHWCPHCQAEVPRVQKWIEEGKQPKDVDIYAVSTAVNSDQVNYPPSKWIVRENFTPPVMLDNSDSKAATAYALPGFPYFVALNADGTVSQRGSGEVPIEQFDQMVKSLKR